MNLWQVATFLKKQNVINAINLDGGGSATYILNGSLANYPSDHWCVNAELHICKQQCAEFGYFITTFSPKFQQTSEVALPTGGIHCAVCSWEAVPAGGLQRTWALRGGPVCVPAGLERPRMCQSHMPDWMWRAWYLHWEWVALSNTPLYHKRTSWSHFTWSFFNALIEPFNAPYNALYDLINNSNHSYNT